ncbi:metallophosphoesterase family protein [Haloarcula litorea]|uniref:metallophosphoesterase family protein n=1 Tax=Haloarcula litorea TaxID=3032579 RepID=UPI0023E88B85|nr:metallophosphoesterase family protein [Halomicroarcula sp. GDY20]
MKLAVISDIHSNLTALEAVLEDVPGDIDETICLGDVVGYGPNPLECVRKVWQHCSTVLQGNHDREFVNPEGYRCNSQAREGLRYSKKQVKGKYREWLQNLPRTTEFLDGDILLAHDHPEQVDRYVTPDEFSDVRQYLDDYEACFLGHTHVPGEKVVDNRLILNPGSVGQPRDGDFRAGYAVVDTSDWSTDLRRVRYNISDVKGEIARAGLPEGIGMRLGYGR